VERGGESSGKRGRGGRGARAFHLSPSLAGEKKRGGNGERERGKNLSGSAKKREGEGGGEGGQGKRREKRRLSSSSLHFQMGLAEGEEGRGKGKGEEKNGLFYISHVHSRDEEGRKNSGKESRSILPSSRAPAEEGGRKRRGK